MQYGVPNINIVNIDDLSSAPVSKYLAHPQTIGANFDKHEGGFALVQSRHDGILVKGSKILKSLDSANKLHVFK